jgi:DNA-binding transcriptional LysR family regulator
MLGRLRERSLDLVMALDDSLLRTRADPAIRGLGDDLNAETLFHDELVVVARSQSRWGSRRKIDLAELRQEPWILTGPDTWNYDVVVGAFRAHGLDLPNVVMTTFSVHLRINLLVAGDFITAMPKSVLHLYGERFLLKRLPIDIPARPWPVAIVTLKNRTLSPVVERFVEHARKVTRPMRENGQSGPR